MSQNIWRERYPAPRTENYCMQDTFVFSVVTFIKTIFKRKENILLLIKILISMTFHQKILKNCHRKEKFLRYTWVKYSTKCPTWNIETTYCRVRIRKEQKLLTQRVIYTSLTFLLRIHLSKNFFLSFLM